MNRRRLSFALVLVGAFQLAGCASIVTGSNQPVSVETVTAAGQAVAGAACKLTNDKGSWFITTPGSTTVQRSYGDLAVLCEKQQMTAAMVSVPSATKAMTFGNILIGGIVGAGVDMATGAAFDYPTLIRVSMGDPPKPASLAPNNQPATVSVAAPTPTPIPAHWIPASCEWSKPGVGVCPPK